VITANLLFGSVAVFHLAYLGLMFDHSSSEESVSNFSSCFQVLKWHVSRRVKYYLKINKTKEIYICN
jgi:hypothetical protein